MKFRIDPAEPRAEDDGREGRTPDELRESEARFRAFADSAMDAFFLLDDQLRLLDVNRQACEGLGYSRDELLDLHVRDFDVGLDEGTFARLVERVLAGETITFETRHRRKDGATLPVEVRARRLEHGGVTCFMALARDITEHKRAEEERRAHLWFLEGMDRVNRAILGAYDLEPMMGDVLDVALGIFDCDRAALGTFYGEPKTTFFSVVCRRDRLGFAGENKPGVARLADADHSAMAAELRAARQPVQFAHGAAPPLYERLMERYGVQSLLWAPLYPKIGGRAHFYLFLLAQRSYPRVWTPPEVRLFWEIALRLGESVTTLAMVRDLRLSEERLAEAERIAQVGYWTRDLEAKQVTLSDEARRIFGLAMETRTLDLAEWQQMWLDRIHAEDRARVMEAAERALQTGTRYDVEYRVIRPSGEVRIVHSRGEVTRDDAGRPRSIFGVMQDISGLRAAEESLRRTQAELAHVSRVMTMGELTASIAHEVNQPLGAMVTSAAACARWLAARPPAMDKARRALERIMHDGKRAGAIVERTRSLTKRQAPRKESLDLNETIIEVLALVRHELQRNEIALETRLAEGLPAVRADRVQVQQVLLNLIINAIEAMSAVAERRHELAIVSAAEGEDTVRVEVRDTGSGLDSESLGRLFEAFYTTKRDGIGIGLSISRSIVEAHGGRLSAEPNTPLGAVFKFSLPLTQTKM